MKTEIHNLFRWFVQEREWIREHKEQGAAYPWTKDERLANYWFPNIRRMDDPTTVWLHGGLLRYLDGLPESQILAAVAFRLFGSQETGEAFAPVFFGSGFWHEGFLESVGPLERPFNTRLQRHHRSLNLESVMATLGALHAENGRWHLLRGASLREASRALRDVPGIGPELAYEIVCDLRRTPVLQSAPDARSWALPGRSATEAAGALLGRDLRSTRQADRQATIELMQDLLIESQAEFPDWEMSEIHRGLTMFHFWTRDKRPTRRYKCTT